MRAQILVAQYNQLLIQRNRLLAAAAILGIVAVLLSASVFCVMGGERIVIAPPVINRDFWVDANTASDSYLEQMAEYFAGLLLNVTPNNFASQSERLLQHTASSHFSDIKTQLFAQRQELERKGMSTAFYLSTLKVDNKKLSVEMSGELNVWVAGAKAASTSKTYRLTFVFQHGRLIIQSFSEVPHA